jgi:hypothetical protein
MTEKEPDGSPLARALNRSYSWIAFVGTVAFRRRAAGSAAIGCDWICHTCRSQYPSGSAHLGGFLPFTGIRSGDEVAPIPNLSGSPSDGGWREQSAMVACGVGRTDNPINEKDGRELK